MARRENPRPQGICGGVHRGARFRGDRSDAIVFEEADRVGAKFGERWLRDVMGGLSGSRGSWPPSVRNSSATSSIVRAIGPIAPRIENGPTQGGR